MFKNPFAKNKGPLEGTSGSESATHAKIPSIDSGEITPEYISNKTFNLTKFHEGYDNDEVDNFLDDLVLELKRLISESEYLQLAKDNPEREESQVPPVIVTPEDVVNKRFKSTKFRGGYDQDEVDDFLDYVVVEFRRLVDENNKMRV